MNGFYAFSDLYGGLNGGAPFSPLSRPFRGGETHALAATADGYDSAALALSFDSRRDITAAQGILR